MSIAHNTNIITNDLVLLLDASNTKSYPGSGNVWYDISGKNNHGMFINGAHPGIRFVQDDIHPYFLFDGIDDYVVNTQAMDLPLGNSERTVSIWFNVERSTTNFIQIGTGGYGTGSQAFIVETYIYGSTTYLYTDGINSSNNLTITAQQRAKLHSWNNIVFKTFNQNYYYYLNGKLQKSGTYSQTLNTVGQQYVIGKRLDYPSDTLKGKVSCVLIYKKALSDEQIKQNFEAYKGKYKI